MKTLKIFVVALMVASSAVFAAESKDGSKEQTQEQHDRADVAEESTNQRATTEKKNKKNPSKKADTCAVDSRSSK